ncbi:MAG: hypothetical protein VB012_05805 [Erysipelotrichaceae bacterium]|nr:hypothetical protein [Erysipelotrichaceae bacterium]
MNLVKHDLRASYRDLFPLYIGLLCFAILAAFTIRNDNWLSIITVLPFFGLFIATIVILVITVIKLFTSRLYSKEGYLTFTLPVSTLDIFISKIITAFIWIILTTFVYLLASVIFGGILSLLNWNSIKEMIGQYTIYWNRINWSLFISGFLKMMALALPQLLVSIAYGCSIILVAVVVVNTSYVSKYKLAIGILIWLGISIILSIPRGYFENEWIINYSNYSVTIQWKDYFITLIYNLLAVIGLISGAVWLNDHKLELE